MEDLENLFTKSQEILGGKIDFVLHPLECQLMYEKESTTLI